MLGVQVGTLYLSSGKLCSSEHAVKVNVTPLAKEQCNRLLDKMIQSGEPHYVDEFTGEIKSSAAYCVEEPGVEGATNNVIKEINVEEYLHKYDFAALFRSKEPFKDY